MKFHEDKYVKLPKARVHYREKGDGAPVVLLHDSCGGTNGQFFWMRNIDPLSKSFRVLAIDVPGWGFTEGIELDKPRPVFLANLVKDVLDALNIDSAHVIGTAHGGAAAATMAILHADRVKKLILNSMSGTGLPLFTPMPSQAVILAAATHFRPDRDNLRQFLELMVHDRRLVTDEMVDYLTGEAQRVLPYHLGQLKNPHFTGIHSIGDFSSIRCETRVLIGREDRMNALDSAILVTRNIPNAELSVLPNCGYWLPFEQADRFNQIVTEFLSRP